MSRNLFLDLLGSITAIAAVTCIFLLGQSYAEAREFKDACALRQGEITRINTYAGGASSPIFQCLQDDIVIGTYRYNTRWM